jgi:hypothetical protein
MFANIKTWRKARGERLCAQNKHKLVKKVPILPGVLPVWSGYECKRCKAKFRGLAFY